MSRIRRLAFGLLAIGLLATGLFGATSIVNPGTAQARCVGQGNEIVSEFFVWTVRLAVDIPLPGTCNGNNAYQGFLVDTHADGGEVAVLAQDIPNGAWLQVARHHEAVNVWVPYSFTDRNGNSHANVKLCSNTGIGEPLVCGWGHELNGHGDNFGF